MTMSAYDPENPGGTRWPPPDLERTLRELGDRFRGFRGGQITVGVGIVLVMILLWSSWFTVQPEETGVVQRFGAVVRTVGPGLHFKAPYGVETVRLVPTARGLKEEFGFLTGDQNVIEVQWIDQYRFEDPIHSVFRVRATRQTIRDIAEAVMRRVVG